MCISCKYAKILWWFISVDQCNFLFSSSFKFFPQNVAMPFITGFEFFHKIIQCWQYRRVLLYLNEKLYLHSVIILIRLSSEDNHYWAQCIIPCFDSGMSKQRKRSRVQGGWANSSVQSAQSLCKPRQSVHTFQDTKHVNTSKDWLYACKHLLLTSL